MSGLEKEQHYRDKWRERDDKAGSELAAGVRLHCR